MLPILKEYEDLRSCLPPNIDIHHLDSHCEIYGCIPIENDDTDDSTEFSPSSLCPSFAPVPANLIHVKDLWAVLLLNCSQLTQVGSIAAYQLLPSSGTMLFYTKEWRGGAFVHHFPEDHPYNRISNNPDIPEDLIQVNNARDTLFLNTNDLHGKEIEDALAKWEGRRKGMHFEDGYYPPAAVRIGGKQPFDGQGNFVIDHDEVMLVQTSHELDYGWCAYGYFMKREDVQFQRWENVRYDIVDDV